MTRARCWWWCGAGLGSQTPPPPRPLLRTAGRLRHCKNNKLSYLQSRVLSTHYTTLHSAGAEQLGEIWTANMDNKLHLQDICNSQPIPANIVAQTDDFMIRKKTKFCIRIEGSYSELGQVICNNIECRYKNQCISFWSLKSTTGQNIGTNLAFLGLYWTQTMKFRIKFGHQRG